MIIRTLTIADKEQWLPLWQGYLDFYETKLAPGTTDATWARLCADGDNCGGFAAVTESGEMIGFVHYLFHFTTWSQNDYCYLEDLYVYEAVRGSGAGRALINAVYQEADRRNSPRVYWITDEQNTRAQTLYDKLAKRTDFIQYRHER